MKVWQEVVPLMQAGYHEQLLAAVDEMRQTETVYPPQELILNALQLTPFYEVRVVLVGQDPYHGPGQAHGLAFSVPEGVKTPPSLRNILKEIRADVYHGEERPCSTDLTRWARQGVLLLNSTLTVLAGKPASHKKLGWTRLTDQIIEQLSRQRQNLVFMLWGRHAQSKRPLIDGERHLVLEAAHPSPLSARKGFFGCKHFSTANAYLQNHGLAPVEW